MRNGPYILVVAPEDYPGKKYRGRYCYEHQLVWWQNTGSLVKESHVIHHINENKHDNRFENLEEKSNSKHSKDHVKPAETIELICYHCNKKFMRTKRDYRSKKKQGQIRFYCCRSHQVKSQWLNGVHSSVAQR